MNAVHALPYWQGVRRQNALRDFHNTVSMLERVQPERLKELLAIGAFMLWSSGTSRDTASIYERPTTVFIGSTSMNGTAASGMVAGRRLPRPSMTQTGNGGQRTPSHDR